MENTLKELTHELDNNTGALGVNLETLTNINTELGIIAEKVLNTDESDLTAMGLQFRDINHIIRLLADTLRYALDEMNENIEHTKLIRENFFDIVIRNEKTDVNQSNNNSHEYPFVPMEQLGKLKND